MDIPKIRALGITQAWSGTSWRATGEVEGIGWIEAWGSRLVAAMAALQALAAARVAKGPQTSPRDSTTLRQ